MSLLECGIRGSWALISHILLVVLIITRGNVHIMVLKRILTQGACVAALAGAMFVAGCGSSSVAATPTATATTIPTATATPVTVPAPAAGFTTYTSADGSYGFNYPTGWKVTTQTVSGISVTAVSNNKDLITVLPLSAKIPSSQYGTLLTSFAQGAKATNVKTNTTITSVPLGANTWNAGDGTLTFQGQSYVSAIFGTDHGPYTTVIIALAPKATANADASQNIIPFVTSFTFLK